MISALDRLAFSMRATKGLYAVLLGSGVSSAAGIPTGWGITQDLIRQLAHVQGEHVTGDPVDWYTREFGIAPDYSKVLESLAGSQVDRQRVLRHYFEPNDEDRALGRKMPTEAHRAIASLASMEHIRVIVTLNFDRLVEQALDEAGMRYTLISTPDQVAGMLPLVHQNLIVVKVNGDYLDTRIRNTESELTGYEEPLEKLLESVFANLGLLICGWSADWDTGLRTVLERSVTRRLPSYWTIREQPGALAKQVIKSIGAVEVKIADANGFFSELAEKVLALDAYESHQTTSPELAAALVKRFIEGGPATKIRLHDFIMRESDALHESLQDPGFDVSNPSPSPTEFHRRLQACEQLTPPLVRCFATGCYWHSSEEPWCTALQRVLNVPENRARYSYQVWAGLTLLPALLALYAGGIASLASENYARFSALLTKVRLIRPAADIPAAVALYQGDVIGASAAKDYLGGGHAPVSNLLFDRLRGPFRDVISSDEVYQRYFDRFEYLLALVQVDIRNNEADSGPFGFSGLFAYRDLDGDWPARRLVWRQVDEEIGVHKLSWPPLAAGLFGGELNRLIRVKKVFDESIGRIRLQEGWG